MQDRREIEQLVWRALLAGGAVALLLTIGGALLFRRQLEHRVGAMPWTTNSLGSIATSTTCSTASSI
jgi:hypothetical protein